MTAAAPPPGAAPTLSTLLLQTQQELIDLRARRDSERRTLDGIVGFGERVRGVEDELAFWESVVDTTVETFECEIALVVEQEEGEAPILLAARGPGPRCAQEMTALEHTLTRLEGTDGALRCAGAPPLTFSGQPIAALLCAAVSPPTQEARQTLVLALSERKAPFFPALGQADRADLLLFASHVGVLHEMLLARQAIADRLRAEQEAAEQRERLIAELARSRRLESVGRLAGGIAHDFNNLLLVILGNADFVRDEPGLSPDAQESADGIVQAATKAAELTQQLLMYSQQQTIAPSVYDLNALLERALPIHRGLFAEAGLTISFSSCPQQALILADAQQVDQVLGHLLANARDAILERSPSPPTRTVAVSTRVVHQGSPLDNGAPAVQLEVQDSGVGMTQATLGRIFEPFFTTKEVGQGSGLGLASVAGVMEQNGGRIDAHSRLGAGSTFVVSWPLHRQGRQQDPPPTRRRAPRRADRAPGGG